MSDTVFVYTMNQVGQVGSWSKYVFPFDIDYFAHLGDSMFIRSGDVVHLVVDDAVTDELATASDPESFTALADSASSPAGQHHDVDVSTNLMVVGHATSPYVTIFDRSSDTFTARSAPATLPPSAGLVVAISPDEQYIAVGSDTTPYVTIYALDGYGDYVKMTNPSTLPTGKVTGLAWTADSQYLAVSHWVAPFLTVYKMPDLTAITASDAGTLGRGLGVAVTGDLIVLAQYSDPELRVWRLVGDTLVRVDVKGSQPLYRATAIAATDSVILYAGEFPELGDQYLLQYDLTQSSPTRMAGPATQPTGVVNDIAISSDGTTMLAAMDGGGVEAWSIDGTTLTSFDPSITLGVEAEGVGWSGGYVAFAQSSSSPDLYSWAGVQEYTEQEFEGTIQWAWLDFGQPGQEKQLIGFDNVGIGTASIQFGYDQSNLATFTASYAIPADSAPGTIIPMPISAPSISVKLVYDGGQSWMWNATTLYLNDNERGS